MRTLAALALIFAAETLWGAFPLVAEQNTSTETAIATTHDLTVHGGTVNSGDLLLWVSCIDRDTATIVTPPAGWTELTHPAFDPELYAAYQVSDGMEAATDTYTTNGSERSVNTIFRITGAASGPEAQSIAANSSSSNPPSITPAGGSADYLIIAMACWAGGQSITGFPASYVSTGQSATGVTVNDVALGWGRREVTGTTEDPAAFTASGSSITWALTLAVAPEAGGIVVLRRRIEDD